MTASLSQLRLPGQAAAPDGPVDLMNMYVMHHAFRRDLGRFRATVHATDASDRHRWRALERRWRLFATVLHHHHAAEDAGLWPLLLTRVTAAGDDAARSVLQDMEAEHAGIDPVLADVAGGLARLADQPDEDALLALRRTVDDAWQLLDGHLGHEERAAMPLVQRHLRESDWQALERDHFRAAYPVRDLLAVVPWAMLGLPREVRDKAFKAAGLPMKGLWWLTKGSFARGEAASFGAAAPWVADTD